MSLIPYPNIPPLPGVPPLPAAKFANIVPTTPGAAVAVGVTIYNSLNQPIEYEIAQEVWNKSLVESFPEWQITDTNGLPILIPDSIIEFEFRGEQKIPNYPIEQGGFATYNKVAMPFDVRVTCSCNGNGPMSKQGFLAAIQVLLSGLQLCSIVTPDATYGPCNLIHTDYRRDSRQGVSLIISQLWFQEIRQTAVATVTTAQPDGADLKNNGQSNTQSPTSAQSAAVNGSPIQ